MTIAAVTSAVSAGVGAYASYASGKAQSDQAEYQAEMAKKQGELSELSARQEAAQLQLDAQRTRARQVTEGAAAGVSVSSGGTLWDVIANSAKTAETERQNTLRAGQLNKEAYGVEAQSYKAAASAAKTGGWLKAGTSLLNGVSNVMVYGNKAGWFEDNTAIE
jgi:hypothetical protein